MAATEGRQSSEGLAGVTPSCARGGGAGAQGRGGWLPSRGLCGGQGIAREILPEQQGLLRLLPSQAVTVVLKIILPPRDREPRRQAVGGARGLRAPAAGRCGAAGGGGLVGSACAASPR